GSHITKLIEALTGLPGIGQKTAQRLAFHIIDMPKENAEELAKAITEARSNVRFCKCCYTLTDDELCPICRSARRNRRQIMVVENSRDLAAYEKTGRYDGLYHVLGGAISPMLGVGPNDIRLKELMQRLQEGGVDEVIAATNSSLEGETTAMYILKLIRTLELPVKVTRIASGVPVGGDIENVDEVTLERALRGRTEMYELHDTYFIKEPEWISTSLIIRSTR
ncbi:MAG: recombination protein RecR, partial [Lachnospiraceae bacterium]|nr:recombination protein RecR [Lachnospiraceae bacterium]